MPNVKKSTKRTRKTSRTAKDKSGKTIRRGDLVEYRGRFGTLFVTIRSIDAHGWINGICGMRTPYIPAAKCNRIG